MAYTLQKIDKPFFISVLILLTAGFFIFSSASLGLLARTSNTFSAVVTNQLLFGLGFGSLACFINLKIPYRFWRRHALAIFIGSIIAMCLLYVPHLGMSHGGARRWIGLFGYSLQPSEIFKIGFVIYCACWLSGIKGKVETFKYGTLSFLILILIAALFILSEPDTATFGVIFITAIAMFLSAGGRFRDILLFGLLSIIVLGILAFSRPYIMDRLQTFINPANDPTGSGYHVQQSLIAIGSGRLTGRGFGQSIQKFNFLPEPIGDSIFAVAAEEFGFIGSILIIVLYLFFSLRGLRIATNSSDAFGRLLVIGIVILILSESFVNIASMLGVLPVSGIPLLFISHGGTALFFTLAEVGIVLNVSKYAK